MRENTIIKGVLLRRALKHRSMQFLRAHLEQAIEQGLVRDGYTADELLFLVHGTALAVVFSGSDLCQATDEKVAPDAVWQSVERLLRAE